LITKPPVFFWSFFTKSIYSNCLIRLRCCMVVVTDFSTSAALTVFV
jgi:hypothetical protein